MYNFFISNQKEKRRRVPKMFIITELEHARALDLQAIYIENNTCKQNTIKNVSEKWQAY